VWESIHRIAYLYIYTPNYEVLSLSKKRSFERGLNEEWKEVLHVQSASYDPSSIYDRFLTTAVSLCVCLG
jgi:hypothetical protein